MPLMLYNQIANDFEVERSRLRVKLDCQTATNATSRSSCSSFIQFFPNEELQGNAVVHLVADLENLRTQLQQGEISYRDPLYQLVTVFQTVAREFHASPLSIEERITGLLNFLQRHPAIYPGTVHSQLPSSQ